METLFLALELLQVIESYPLTDSCRPYSQQPIPPSPLKYDFCIINACSLALVLSLSAGYPHWLSIILCLI